LYCPALEVKYKQLWIAEMRSRPMVWGSMLSDRMAGGDHICVVGIVGILLSA